MQEEFDKQEFKAITGWDTPEEMAAYDKGREDERGVITAYLENWDGHTNSYFGQLLMDKFKELNKKEPYGWVMEWNINTKYQSKDGSYKWTGWSGWDRGHKHKCYKTREIAIEAVNASKLNGSNTKVSYRILPVYSGEPEMLDDNLNLPLKQE